MTINKTEDNPVDFESTENNIPEFENTKIKIMIFKTQVKEWFLNRANELVANEDNDFIVLMICSSYIESIWQYINWCPSERRGAYAFTQSLKNILEISKLPASIYSNMRCGLFHNNMLNNNIRVSRRFANEIIKEENKIIYINPKKLLEKICQHFDTYIEKLAVDKKLYDNFEKMFKFENI